VVQISWTTPKTWSAGETLTAANFNAHIRDNLSAVGNHYKLRKTGDQSVTSSVTLVDDTHLTFTIGANEEWILDLMLHVNTGAGGIQLQITGPAGSTGISQEFNDTTGGSVSGTHSNINTPVISAAATFTNEPFWVKATVINGATPGTCRLQFAQGSSNGTASTVKQNSHMIAHRIA
jgi:hypothetical protein